MTSNSNQISSPVSANKIAMSRALGAAFLNYEVEQLEKSVNNGPSAGNWRARRYPQQQQFSSGQVPVNEYSRSPPKSFGKAVGGTKPATAIISERKKGGEVQVATKDRAAVKDGASDRHAHWEANSRRRSGEDERDSKDADVIVVDASVLVNALYQVKKWCREGRDEIIIVPLEALNTLDLLKKGTSPLAQRARAASRFLEAQVGTNPRIRVQRDDAFVLWDSIAFKDLNDDVEPDNLRPNAISQPSPEWVRRTICCASWEVENPTIDEGGQKSQHLPSPDSPRRSPKVVLAVLATPPSLSPKSHNSNLPMTPVPLPSPSSLHCNKAEPRSSGILVSFWASRADIELLKVDPTAPPQVVAGGRHSEDDDRGKRGHPHNPFHAMKGRRPSYGHGNDAGGITGLVERPPAVMAMMEMVAQPSKVVRVLARGEKLEPDP